MGEKLISNDQINLDNKVSEYENLLTKLKEISTKIALLEKKYLDRF